ncbi:MAG: uroporphyrinogen decarboxylase [Parachlamydiaceae bacterium]|nr:uroporphyrinogen decarboxylase [Parachlamydiaceae bacterium]
MNQLLLQALKCRNQGRAPVWLMRQAGRYMPEYRALRTKYSFLEMCHNPELVAEVTLLPIRSFGMDAAILFSDILVIPEALQVGLRFDDGVGPIIERPLNTAADVDALPAVNMREALNYVAEGIALLRPQLDVPLLGFCGAPFTVASYMIEGKSSRDLRKTKEWMLRDPISFHKLLDRLADDAIDYLLMQADAGVQAVQVFDSWAGVLAPGQFREFSLAYLEKIVRKVESRVPVIVFCRGSSIFAPELAEIQPSAISLDWHCHPSKVRQALPQNIALQGNLDPDILYAPLPVIRKEVTNLLKSMQGDPGYIFNLGHGITPGVPVEAVRELVDCVKSM